MGVFLIFARVIFVIHIQRGRGHIKAAAPNVNLLIAVLLARLLLVKPRERAVVTLIDAPVFGDGDMDCLLYTSPSPRDATLSRMPSSA